MLLQMFEMVKQTAMRPPELLHPCFPRLCWAQVVRTAVEDTSMHAQYHFVSSEHVSSSTKWLKGIVLGYSMDRTLSLLRRTAFSYLHINDT